MHNVSETCSCLEYSPSTLSCTRNTYMQKGHTELKKLSQTYLGTRIEYSWIEVPEDCWKVNNTFI